MKIGYARVSTIDQNLDLQLNALQSAGCELIFQEKVSGGSTDRPELQKLLQQLKPGDHLVVWKLDRLGRETKDLIKLVSDFKQQGIDFSSLSNHIDTSTPGGVFIFHVFSALAELERNQIRERTLAGLAAAKLRGKTGGKPKGLTDEAKKTARVAESLYREGYAVTLIAEQLYISRQTVYTYLKYRGVDIKSPKPN